MRHLAQSRAISPPLNAPPSESCPWCSVNCRFTCLVCPRGCLPNLFRNDFCQERKSLYVLQFSENMSATFRKYQSRGSSSPPEASSSGGGGPNGISAIEPLEQLFPLAGGGAGSNHDVTCAEITLSHNVARNTLPTATFFCTSSPTTFGSDPNLAHHVNIQMLSANLIELIRHRASFFSTQICVPIANPSIFIKGLQQKYCQFHPEFRGLHTTLPETIKISEKASPCMWVSSSSAAITLGLATSKAVLISGLATNSGLYSHAR